MRTKLAFLAVVGAVIALAAPASSMAAFSPTNTKFEIKGDANGPKINTPLGSCTLAKISGVTPSNETINIATLSTPTPGTCTGGASITPAGSWYLDIVSPFDVRIRGGLTIRFASLPGCKLSGTPVLGGAWFNGLTSPSVYHPESTATMTWANDGGTCALAGKSEAIRYEAGQTSGSVIYPAFETVANASGSSTPIRIR